MKTPSLDCGDSGCRYASDRSGMRTNGGCRCDLCPFCDKYLRHGHRSWCRWAARVAHLLAWEEYRRTLQRGALQELREPSQSGDQNAPDTAEPAEKQPDSR